MMTNLFTQFDSPHLVMIPLIFVALLVPAIINPQPSDRWIPNRLETLQRWFLKQAGPQLLGSHGPESQQWALTIVSYLVFLMTINVLGLFPFTFTPTTHLSVTLSLALPAWLATVLIGFRKNPTKTLAHLLPQSTPTPLLPLLIVIETISLLIRPIALAVRLMANLTAGHLLLQLCSMATLAMLKTFPPLALATVLLLTLLAVLELAVAMIQAYVFTLLVSLYLQENI